MHHTEEVGPALARVELEHHNTDNGGNFVVVYLWVGDEIAGSMTLNLQGEFVSDQAAEMIASASATAMKAYWTA